MHIFSIKIGFKCSEQLYDIQSILKMNGLKN